MKLYGEQGHKQEKNGTGEPEKQGILGKKPPKKWLGKTEELNLEVFVIRVLIILCK